MHMLRSQKQVRPTSNIIMASCRYNPWILAECGVGTEHGSLVQTFISPSICTFECICIYDNNTYMTIIYIHIFM